MDNKVLILFVAVLAMSGAVYTVVPADYGGGGANLPTHDDENQEFMDSLQIQKHDDYLYSLTYDDYDYDLGAEAMEKYKVGGACSSVWNNGIVGRNYDWCYDNAAEFVISVPAKGERHASLGVAHLSEITDKMASSGEYSELYRVLPFFTVDGINDAQVECNVNVVSYGDHGITEGSNPKGEDLCMIMAVRYVLDYADSAADAVKMLSEKNLYPPHTKLEECHLMISDLKESYVIEIIDNVYTILKDEKIMTNFYLSDVVGLEFGSGEYFESLTNHPMGYERYEILYKQYNLGESVEGMTKLMHAVFYTHAYGVDGGNTWYSEFYGDYKEYGIGDLNKKSPKEDFEPVIKEAMEKFRSRTRDGDTWQTVHSSIYDLKAGKLFVSVQEKDKAFEFSLGAA